MDNLLPIFYFFGRPFAPFYGALMALRRWSYGRIITQHRLSVPVISVGNLMMGGTGKTPLVRFLAQYLIEKGYKPAIISRGYGGTAKAPYNIVSDGKELLLTAEQAGDEPYMLAASLLSSSFLPCNKNGVPVITGRKRIFPARYAVEELSADCILLDDGFQHIALYRDINIVLFDSTTLAGNSRIFPAGPLREAVSALKDADCFVMSGTTDTNKKRAEAFTALLRRRFPEKEAFLVRRGRFQFRKLNGEHIDITGKAAFAFCGIACPERFRQTLSEQGIELRGFLPFSDHKRYDEKSVARIIKQAEAVGVEILITTEKDAAKLKGKYKKELILPVVVASFDIDNLTDFICFFQKKLEMVHK